MHSSCSCSKMGKLGSERLGDVPSVTQLIRALERQAEARPVGFSNTWRGCFNNTFFSFPSSSYPYNYLSLAAPTPANSPSQRRGCGALEARNGVQSGSHASVLFPLRLFLKTLSIGGH